MRTPAREDSEWSEWDCMRCGSRGWSWGHMDVRQYRISTFHIGTPSQQEDGCLIQSVRRVLDE